MRGKIAKALRREVYGKNSYRNRSYHPSESYWNLKPWQAKIVKLSGKLSKRLSAFLFYKFRTITTSATIIADMNRRSYQNLKRDWNYSWGREG